MRLIIKNWWIQHLHVNVQLNYFKLSVFCCSRISLTELQMCGPWTNVRISNISDQSYQVHWYWQRNLDMVGNKGNLAWTYGSVPSSRHCRALSAGSNTITQTSDMGTKLPQAKKQSRVRAALWLFVCPSVCLNVSLIGCFHIRGLDPAQSFLSPNFQFIWSSLLVFLLNPCDPFRLGLGWGG